MWLSKVNVTFDEIEEHGLTDDCRWKQELYRACPVVGDRRPFLFRNEGRSIMVLSREEPKPLTYGQWTIKEIPTGFLNHRKYAFQVLGNPVAKKCWAKDGVRQKNSIEAPLPPDQYEAWLTRELGKMGCTLESVICGAKGVKEIRHRQVRANGVRDAKESVEKKTFVDFRGILSVNDKDLFRDRYLEGLGGSKAFGFGLILLRPF